MWLIQKQVWWLKIRFPGNGFFNCTKQNNWTFPNYNSKWRLSGHIVWACFEYCHTEPVNMLPTYRESISLVSQPISRNLGTKPTGTMLQIKSNVMPSGVEAQAKTPFNSQITHLPTHRDNPKTNSILFYFACPEHSRRFFWTGKKSRYTTKLKTKNQQLTTKN